MDEKSIWEPVAFNPKWNDTKTEKFDNIYPSWERRRFELSKQPEQYAQFIDQLKRKQAIDTGIIEQMYDLKRGVTETFIREGFADSYLQHGDTDIAPSLLMSYLRDNFDAIDFIFDFVKNNRQLSVSYIKELHHLITQHQESTDAIDSLGNRTHISLLKGQFKQRPNNPVRDGVVYNYCPPEHVDSEMDNLVGIFNTEISNAHVLIKAAYLHHTFVQIHPFQDGNGRIARLLSSFVLIREGLFPFSLDRSERIKYIDALEYADNHEYQQLIDVIATNQIISIERALNWRTVTSYTGYENLIDIFGEKLSNYRITEAEQQNQRIRTNMSSIFEMLKVHLEHTKDDLISKLDKTTLIQTGYCAPDEQNTYYYATQIINYAKEHDYYVNLSFDKCWGRLFVQIDGTKMYRLVISLHHYGYDNSTFAIGGFLSKVISEKNDAQRRNKYVDVSLGLPPLTISSEKKVTDLVSSINQQVELSIMTMLAYIANELG